MPTLEHLAIYWAVIKWRKYLSQKFDVYTNHKKLTSIQKQKFADNCHTMKQDTTQATSFELVYGRTATLLVEIETKKRHDNQLSDKPVEFKIEDKVLLHCTKVEKQWSGKFDPK
ncbi:hypothetical protein G9A89_008310 [Geosiphon pyriformis]|nr:hypothetical protein G9A89_008310 [Geosiphon pyriformis]